MTPSLIVVLFGAIAAVAGTVVLARSCARAPKIFLIAWTAALFGLAVALAGQSIGDLAGYSGTIFRAMELGAQAVAPLALCLALVELAGKSLPARFLMRLGVAAISVIVLVILGTDPVNPAVGFSKRWPDPAIYYEFVPKGLIEALAVFTMVTAICAAGVAMIRSSRGTERAELLQPTMATAGAAALVALPGIAMAARLPLPAKDVFALALALAVGATWFAARAADHRGLFDEPLRGETGRSAGYQRPGGGARQGADSGSYRDRNHEAGDFGGPGSSGRADGRYGGRDRETSLSYPGLAALAAEADEPGAGYRDRAGYDSHPYGDVDRTGDHDRYAGVDRTGDYGRFSELDRTGDPDRYGPAGPAGDHDAYPGIDQTGDHGLFDASGPYPDELAGGFGPGQRARAGYDDDPLGAGNGATPRGHDPRGTMFGQITIYTLLDDRVDDFDRLTERVVEQVRAREPGTLAYIVHAVPTAPLQRILYEVYQDRDAYTEHLSRPYVARYESERRRFVLATNVIELGLQQAKVSPFPSFSAISDILSESGIDLTGVTRPPRRGRPDDPGPRDDRGHPGHQEEQGYGGWAGLRREDSSYQ